MSSLGWPDGLIDANVSLAIVLVLSLGATSRLFGDGTADNHGTPPSAMWEVAGELGQAEFVELSSGGHLSVAEHPRPVADLIANWISKKAGQ